MSKELDQALKDHATKLDEMMGRLLPEVQDNVESRLFEAMRYMVLSPSSKRLRPFLVVESSRLFGVSQEAAYQTAAAIEFIHTYSLIHDDLPCMDNDDMRRGMPSCHKKFDEATAVLAGDALLTLAFEILSDRSTHPDSNARCELIKSVAKASGGQGGMVGGQMMDMLCEGIKMNMNEVTRLQRMKTGMLFAVSCEAGAILGKASPNLRMALRGYANSIGLAFQITDDLMDYEGVGGEKIINEAEINKKATYINILGYEKAKEQVKMLSEQAVSHLDSFESKADLLRDLAKYIVVRQR